MALSIRAKTLNLVNKIRKAFGAKSLVKMPKGNVGKVASCPIANGIPCEVSVDGATARFTSKAAAMKAAEAIYGKEAAADYISHHFWHTHKPWQVSFPSVMADFVNNFDSKMYPDLVK